MVDQHAVKSEMTIAATPTFKPLSKRFTGLSPFRVSFLNKEKSSKKIQEDGRHPG
jgi:hypothetical protein